MNTLLPPPMTTPDITRQNLSSIWVRPFALSLTPTTAHQTTRPTGAQLFALHFGVTNTGRTKQVKATLTTLKHTLQKQKQFSEYYLNRPEFIAEFNETHPKLSITSPEHKRNLKKSAEDLGFTLLPIKLGAQITLALTKQKATLKTKGTFETFKLDAYTFESPFSPLYNAENPNHRKTLRNTAKPLGFHMPSTSELKAQAAVKTMTRLNSDPDFRDENAKRASERMTKQHQDPEFAAKHAARSSKRLQTFWAIPGNKEDYSEAISKAQARILHSTHLLPFTDQKAISNDPQHKKIRQECLEQLWKKHEALKAAGELPEKSKDSERNNSLPKA